MKIIRLGKTPKAGRPAERWPVFYLASNRTRFFRLGERETMTCGPVREAIGVFQDEPSLGAATGHAAPWAGAPGAPWACAPEAPSTASIGNDARTQAKAAFVAGLGYLGAMGAVTAVISSGGTVTAAATGAGILGGPVGGAMSLILDRRHAGLVRQRLACRGLRPWVQTVDQDPGTRACPILKRQAARDVPVEAAGHTGRIFSTA